MFRRVGLVVSAVCGVASLAGAAAAQDYDDATVADVVVTGTKMPIPASAYPGAVTVINGEELRARGVGDLRTALSLTAGVDAPPGGDTGPAGAAVAFWGLQEFDAFLLVVDGVPFGGAFNPQVPALDFNNIERIEVLKGAAPISYGASSFVGVVQVFHYAPGSTPGRAGVELGTRGRAGAYFATDLPKLGDLNQSIALDADINRFSQDRSGVQRFHGQYRLGGDTAIGRVRLDLDATALRQDPYAPHPLEGGELTPRLRFDSNTMPSDARQDQNRYQATFGLERQLGWATWTTTLSATRTNGNTIKGFLRDGFADDGVTHNADGYSQKVRETDGYADTYLTFTPASTVKWLVGADWNYGSGRQNSNNFEYAAQVDGSPQAASSTLEVDEATEVIDRRNFFGLYSSVEWTPDDRWLVSAGVRLNNSHETRFAQVIDEHAPPGTPPEESGGKQTRTRLGYSLGVSYALWRQEADNVTLFADYRDTFKPAAIDFGPEGEGDLLKPETARSWEAGLRGHAFGGRLSWEADTFLMDFKNLVIADNVGGLPSLANAGAERFQGAEVEGRWRVMPDLEAVVDLAWHDAKYTDFPVDDGMGGTDQLAGNSLPSSPKWLASYGLIYSPPQGLQATLVAHYVGKRFLTQENDATAGAYTTFDATLGWRGEGWTVRLVGRNLSDRRDPVAESELGPDQYYTLPGRTVAVVLEKTF